MNRPTRVTDLNAVEHGTKIVVTYTRPTRTTEDLPIKGGGEAELRIGEMPNGRFDIGEWERTSDRIKGKEVDAQKYYGKNVVIALRVVGPRGQSAGWSNFVPLTVVPTLAMPEGLAAKNVPDAVQLDWHGTAPAYRIYRDGELLSTSKTTQYTDSTIEYGKTYQYYVQAATGQADQGQAESEVSETIDIKPVDTFAPAVPSGITVAPGTRTIELLWDRNTEKDLAGYSVYRDGKKLADSLKSPSYSDKDVKAGTKYSYQVTAKDTKGNESPRSNPIESLIP